ncbi:ArgP/LysG family DNA-binding transcriptional regulator [Vibrio sp. SCSIO 43137]|uniref:ArgP/LysG family DNA-binding transcriptional regulator n=1 Tax=Vibrio sp. SCSIO 43137 TaxID=3021011 RepID=UPI002306F3E8|nr:ArgP/LysG family DNA-binding transcriptional regulator [Vibrio sp. SCSIO 43137]WCE32408.1 ArgP/LysG family DNA-binding transcriptional regulator [Vibrio sp. SCSIO 43137]
MLDNKELETLIAIVDEQSFDKAARQLNVSPGAVSQRVKSLENRVGSTVLIRSTPPVTTETGKKVLAYARRLLLIHNEMEQALEDGHCSAAVPLTIAVNHDSLSCWFGDVVTRLAENTPYRFDIRASDTVTTQSLLKTGEVMAAVTSKANQIAGCKSRYLGKLEYYAVCSQDFYQRYFSDGVSSARLSKAPSLAFDHEDNLVSLFMQQEGHDSKTGITHYLPCSYSLLNAVKKGMGWTLVAKPLIDKFCDSDNIVILHTNAVYIDLYWNCWDQISSTMAKVEQHVLSVSRQSLSFTRS